MATTGWVCRPSSDPWEKINRDPTRRTSTEQDVDEEEGGRPDLVFTVDKPPYPIPKPSKTQ